MERVAFYAPMKPPDHPVPSGERETARLFRQALSRAGFDVELACRLSSRDARGDPARQARLERAGRWIADRLVRGYLARPTEQRPIAWLTYHLYYKAMDWIGPSVARALDIPYLAGEVSVAPKRAEGPWRHSHEALLQTIARADCIFPLTDVNAECLPATTKLAALEPFVDPAPFKQALSQRTSARSDLAARLQLNADIPWIAVAAMMRFGVKSESYALLSDALGRLSRLPFHVLAAGDGPARQEVEARFGPALAERVRFLGCLDQGELAKLFAASDLYAWPSIGEAFGVSLLEAQAAGLPVVAARHGGVGSVVGHEESGLLAASGSVEAFADSIGRLLQSGDLRQRLSRGAAARIEQRHSLAKAAETLGRAIASARRNHGGTGNACPSPEDQAR